MPVAASLRHTFSPNTTVRLPQFPDDEGELVRHIQRQLDDQQLAGAADGMLAADALLLASGAAAQPGQMVLGGVCLASNEAASQSDSYPMWRVCQQQKLVFARRAQRSPMAWACSTVVAKNGAGKYVSSTAITARRLQDFHHVALRRPAQDLQKVYEQYLYVVGTYCAVDEDVAGAATDRAAARARLCCLLGTTGDQLQASYETLASPSLTGLMFAPEVASIVMFSFLLTIVLGAGVAAHGSPEGLERTASGLTAGACLSLAAGAVMGAAVALRRRPEHHHIKAFARVRDTHRALLAQPTPPEAQLRQTLQEARDYVVRHSHPVAVRDPEALPLLPLPQQALDELYAYWLPGEAPAAFDSYGTRAHPNDSTNTLLADSAPTSEVDTLV